jgi:hypothetical protein
VYIEIGIERHDASDGRLRSCGLNSDLRCLKCQRAILGTGIVQELADDLTGPRDEVSLRDGGR